MRGGVDDVLPVGFFGDDARQLLAEFGDVDRRPFQDVVERRRLRGGPRRRRAARASAAREGQSPFRHGLIV